MLTLFIYFLDSDYTTNQTQLDWSWAESGFGNLFLNSDYTANQTQLV